MPNLILGWQVNAGLDPLYWTSQKAKPGHHSLSDLFQMPPSACATHTAIIAQSGSGKSYFLGRLLEEVALRTRVRCLVIDPNGDFRRLRETVDGVLWTDAKYDLHAQTGMLPHEKSREEFASAWAKIRIRIRGGARSHEESVSRIRVPWLSVSPEFIAENLGPVERTGVRNCHSFMRAMHDLLTLRGLVGQTDVPDYLARVERFLRQAVDNPEDFGATIREEWSLDGLSAMTDTSRADAAKRVLRVEGLEKDVVRRAIDERIADALTAARAVGETARRFYFGKLGACRATGVIDEQLSSPMGPPDDPSRIDVLDLPSIDDPTRLLVVTAALESEWNSARVLWELALQSPVGADCRVPLLVFVDEAHNLVPREPRNLAEGAIRDQFRTLVAEGRKFGVFVVLVSQRPDKVDPVVMAECENRAVMKISSETTLELTRKALGLEEVPEATLSSCLKFSIGRALMVGPWSPQGPRVMYAAARRTVEGGRNLRKEYWTGA